MPRRVLVYTCCPGVTVSSSQFYYQTCPFVDVNLNHHPTYLRRKILSHGISSSPTKSFAPERKLPKGQLGVCSLLPQWWPRARLGADMLRIICWLGWSWVSQMTYLLCCGASLPRAPHKGSHSPAPTLPGKGQASLEPPDWAWVREESRSESWPEAQALPSLSSGGNRRHALPTRSRIPLFSLPGGTPDVFLRPLREPQAPALMERR